MLPAEILEKINLAEASAREKIETARHQAADLLAGARARAAELGRAGREKAELRSASIIKKARLDADEAALRLAEKSQKDRVRMGETLNSRATVAVQFVLKEFKKFYGSR